MTAENGLIIASVEPESIGELSGFLPGDIVISINDHRVNDIVDLMFYLSDSEMKVVVRRNGKILQLHLSADDTKQMGIHCKPFRIKTCKNNCIFCFVKQLPKKLRRSLYVKDDDYRMSFLYGNYITFSNLRWEDKERIIRQRLSPLYISVHTTDTTLRNLMLGNPKGPDILKELKFLAANRIRFHVQIVLCPGYNDSKGLQHTLDSLSRFYPYLLSIAVVPVGITRYSKQNIAPVDQEDAVNALAIVNVFQKRMMKKYGNPLVFGSDELYLKAGHPFPPLRQYGELHQLENGVGMVPLFLHQAQGVEYPVTPSKTMKTLTFTGTSFFPFLKSFSQNFFYKTGIQCDVAVVENTFFGSAVTVAGLLTGMDIIRSLSDMSSAYERILIPDVVLNEDNLLLDDMKLEDIEKATGTPVQRVRSSPNGLVDALTGKNTG